MGIRSSTIPLALLVATAGGSACNTTIDGTDQDTGFVDTIDGTGDGVKEWPIVRVSIASDGTQQNLGGIFPSISKEGRFVSFVTEADNLVEDDSNQVSDVFEHDRDADGDGSYDDTDSGGRETVRASVTSSGEQGTGGPCSYTSTSDDGRYVAFGSAMDDLASQDTNNAPDIFVFDRQTGTTVQVSVASDGTPANPGLLNQGSINPDISGSGRFVAFRSSSSNLVAGDTNNVPDVFVHDRDADEDGEFDESGEVETIRVNVDDQGNQAQPLPGLGGGGSGQAAISGDGRFVAFASTAGNLVDDDTNKTWDVFVHDRDADEDGKFDETEDGARATRRVSLTSGGEELAQGSLSWKPAISDDGSQIAFESTAPELTGTTRVSMIFVRDRAADGDGGAEKADSGDSATAMVSVGNDGEPLDDGCEFPSISGDGALVSFHCHRQEQGGGEVGARDVYVHHRDLDGDDSLDEREKGSYLTGLVSRGRDGSPGDGPSEFAQLSRDGNHVVFVSGAPKLVEGDTNGEPDIFVVSVPPALQELRK